MAALIWMTMGWSLLSPVAPATSYAHPEKPAPVVQSVIIQKGFVGGSEAILEAMDSVVSHLTDSYYEQYGGLLVSRGHIEKKVWDKVHAHQEEILDFVASRFSADGVAPQFNPDTDQVAYYQNQVLRTISVAEIASSILLKFQENS
jgi:hypothetical protein